jgi:tetratricopeptide (TPR) repeat protein
MTVKNSPIAGASKPSSPVTGRPNLPRPFLIGTLVVLMGVAIYVWTRPILLERQLSHAKLSELEAMAKQQDDPRILYYLGLRQREKGDAKAAFDSLGRATRFTVSDTQIWLAYADVGKAVEGDQTAFNILGMFVKNNPDNPIGHLAMARLYIDHRSWRRAREEASRATEKDPKLAEAWRIAGQAALVLELASDAESALRHAIALAPNDWQSQAALGDALAAQNRFQESVPVYQEAVRLAPNEAGPALSLGRAILKANQANITPEQLAAAEQSLQHSIQIRGDIAPTYLLLGQCLAQQNRLPEARAALEHARDLAPADPDAYFELIRVATKMGDLSGAAQYRAQHTEVLQRRNAFGDRVRSLHARIDNAISAGQESTADGLRRELARVLAEGGEPAEALQLYGIVLNSYPNDTALQREASEVRRQMAAAAFAQLPLPALLTQGDTFLTQKQFSNALVAYGMALKRDPKSSRAMEGKGLALQALERYEEATYYLLAATRLDANLPRAEFALGARYKEIGFLAQAVERFRKVIELEPKNATAWDALGQVLRDRDGSEADAEAAFQNAVDLEPANTAYLVDLADMQDTNNKKMQAESVFRRALALAPGSAEVVASLGAFLVNNPTNAARRDEAGSLLRRALTIDPNDAFAQYYQGKLALQQGDAKRAVVLLEAVQKRGGDANNQETWYSLGRAYIRNGDKVKGEKAMAIAHKMESDNVAYAQAREQLALHPNDPVRHITLARAFVERGDNARAIREYERTLRLDSKNAVAQRELTALKTRLTAEGSMPSMAVYDALVSAADTHVRNTEHRHTAP